MTMPLGIMVDDYLVYVSPAPALADGAAPGPVVYAGRRGSAA